MCNEYNDGLLYLDTPASPHVIISANGVALTHETKVHGRADELPVEGKVHATHWEESALHTVTSLVCKTFHCVKLSGVLVAGSCRDRLLEVAAGRQIKLEFALKGNY